MLAGTPPFDGESPLAIAMKQVKNDAPPLRLVRPDVPQAVCNLIHRMIEKSPEDRPQSADEVLRVLKQINLDEAYALDDIKISSLSMGSPSTETPQRAKLSRAMANRPVLGSWRGWLLGLLGLCLTCIAWLGGVWAAHLNQPEDLLEISVTTDAPSEQPVRKLSSVDHQYTSTYWSTFDSAKKKTASATESHWKAVIDYFPIETAGDAENKTKLYHQRAYARLGEIYLTQKRFDEAYTVYQKLANSGDLDRRFQVIGGVGKAIILDARSPEEFEGGREEQDAAIRKLLEDVGEDRNMLNPFLVKPFDSLTELYSPLYSSDL